MSTGSGHHTVHIEIHRVIPPVKPDTVYRGTSDQGTPRQDIEIMNITVRTDGMDSASLDKAINKAIKHIEAERPNPEGK